MTPELLAKLNQLGLAYRAVHRELRKTLTQAEHEGFKWPSVLEYVLRNAERSADDLALFLEQKHASNQP